MSTLHVFIYVCPAQEDFFFGIRENLKNATSQQHSCMDIHLEEEEYKYITKVEFSIRRYFRFLYYGTIFKKIESLIIEIIKQCNREQSIVFYLADEGVWAELVRDIIERNRITRRSILVNVQHGFMLLEKVGFIWLRELFNFIAKKSFGYPIFGYGFGGGACDVHLVYSSREVQFLEGIQIPRSIPCPELIKHDLLDQYKSQKNLVPVESDLILLALPACVKGSEMRCSLQEFLHTIAPIVKWVKEKAGYRVLVRPHPGRRDNATIKLILKSHLGPYVEVDRKEVLISALSRSVIVMAAHSTVLFDAYCLGKMPVALRSHCYQEPLPFHYPHEVIDVRSPFAEELVHILSDERRKYYSSRLKEPELDWKQEIEAFTAHYTRTN